MCGIAGLINLGGENVSQTTMKMMTDAIAHRGPDGEGHWIKDNIGLGHRRLAIIDLTESGKQPMISRDNRFVLVFNGEIYNYREIRKELEFIGKKFIGTSDTEVLLEALIEWGEETLQKLNGMFAFAFWDNKYNTLLIARDRYGIKPLYYAIQNNIFIFASEQKAIISHPEFKRTINKSALFEYFTFQNIFTSQTLFEDVNILPAGHWMRFNKNQKNFKTNMYWDYRFKEENHASDLREYSEELDRLFKKAVERQLVSDVEIGTYLSGGMDSGSISAIASKHSKNIKSFTVGFDLSSASGLELAFDERTKAEAMSAQFKTEHYEMVLKSGDMERSIKSLAWHLEEPRVGQSYPNYYAAKLASKFVKVVLSGSGGDELFGGYPWRYYRTINTKNFEQFINEYYKYWQRLVSKKELNNLFTPLKGDIKNVCTETIFRDIFLTYENNLNSPNDCINHCLYLEAKTFLHGLFIVEDKLSMAHGLESRVPFMDNDLVDFAMKCPVSFKLKNLRDNIKINENTPGDKFNNYISKRNDGKNILRKVMNKYIPNNITNAKKQGFSSPDASWFKGESIDFVRDTLLNKNSIIYNYLDINQTKKLVQEHLKGKKNRRLLIWSLINVNKWMELYLQ
tara:strand:+ start:1803 stop:3677 length:1875 start_codon:yes stop_codon:yes gene_type:complete